MEKVIKNKFHRDLKRCKKRGKELKKIRDIMDDLIAGKKLPQKLKDHALQADYRGYRECHIEPDWLMIYKRVEGGILFLRTGSHADLFE